MIRFRLPDGRIVGTNDLPITEASYFILTEADEGMVVRCFQGDETSLTHVVSIGIRHEQVADFVAQVKQCAVGMKIDWENIPVREVPEGPTSTGH